jgi:uncharacterized HAD superfamily protein
MNIGIDFDGVIVKEPHTDRTRVLDGYMRKLGYRINDKDAAEWHRRYGADKSVIDELKPDIVSFLMHYDAQKSANQGFELQDYFDFAYKALKEDRHKLFLITARGNPKYGTERDQEAMILSTRRFLQDSGFTFDGYSFGNEDKTAAAKRFNIDIMIDDTLKHAEAMSRICVRTLQFLNNDDKYQKNGSHIANVDAVVNWLDVIQKISQSSLDRAAAFLRDMEQERSI